MYDNSRRLPTPYARPPTPASPSINLLDYLEAANQISRREYPSEMFFIEFHRHPRTEAAQIVEEHVAAKGQVPIENPIAAGAIGKVFEDVPYEIVEAVKTEMKVMSGIGVRIDGAEMGCSHNHFSIGLRHSMNLRHGAKDVRLMLDEMRKIYAAGAVIAQRPGETRQLRKNVRPRTGLAINANGARLLFLFAASDVKNYHSQPLESLIKAGVGSRA
jgi:hypothetical protein